LKNVVLGFKNELEKDNKANGVYLKMGGSPLNCPSDFKQIKEMYYLSIYLFICLIYLPHAISQSLW
jgi:hypothetical protein